MTEPLPNRPTSELVTIAWIASVPGLSAGMVDEQLPPPVGKDKQPAQWVLGQGFITASVVTGTPDPDVPVRKPVMQIDCYAAKPGSSKPPWHLADRLAETIIAATFDTDAVNRLLRIAAHDVEYAPAAVDSCFPLMEPRRIWDDPGSYARYQFDMQFIWQTVGRFPFT